jgi:chaperonin cofactor prefoldin
LLIILFVFTDSINAHHMRVYVITLLLVIAKLGLVAAQVKLGSYVNGRNGGPVDGSATLEVAPGPYAAGSPFRGLLLPRMNISDRNQIQNPAIGLMLYNVDNKQVEVNVGSPTGPVWGPVVGSGTAWTTSGNSGLVDGTNFLGTGDDAVLNFRVFNQPAGRIDHKLFNAGFGFFSINPSTTGTYNTAIGSYTLRNNSSGIANTAVGAGALTANLSGTANTGIGHDALIANTSGTENTGAGQNALRSNQDGFSNTAIGADALYNSTSGYDNTGLGGSALFYNTTGYSNTAGGALSLRYNTTGYNNTALGNYALQNNTNGFLNTSIGFNAGPSSGNGGIHHSISIGSAAVSNAIYSIAIGSDVTVNNSNNGLSVAIGSLSSVGANVTNSTVIGARGVVNSSNTIVLGDANITSLRCNVQSISSLSDRRVKYNIKENVPGLKFVMRLNPVTYRINKDKVAEITGDRNAKLQKDEIVHSGFIAQDVEKAAKETNYNFEGVRKEENGKYYTLGYTLFVVPLVQAVKELSLELEETKDRLNSSEKALSSLSAEVEELKKIVKKNIALGADSNQETSAKVKYTK